MATLTINRATRRTLTIRQWLGRKNKTFSSLCGEVFTNQQVLLAHLYCIALIVEKPLYFNPFGQIEFAPVGHNIIAPCKVLVQGSILFYPFRDSGFS